MAKFAKNCGLWPPEAETMNTFRWYFAGKYRPWVCYSTPNLAFIGKRGSVQEPPKCQNLPKIVVFGHWKPTQWTHSDEIWRVSFLHPLSSSFSSLPTSPLGVFAHAAGFAAARRCLRFIVCVIFVFLVFFVSWYFWVILCCQYQCSWLPGKTVPEMTYLTYYMSRGTLSNCSLILSRFPCADTDPRLIQRR